MKESDYSAVQAILQAGMDSGNATFEAEAPSWESFAANKLLELTFVAEADNGEILGWISASTTSHREVFHGVIEDSIYVAPDAAGKGVAGMLLDHLIDAATKAGCWSIHSSIFPENSASLRLHEARGFNTVGTFHCMSRMNYGPHEGSWRDTVILELILRGGPAWDDFIRRFPSDAPSARKQG